MGEIDSSKSWLSQNIHKFLGALIIVSAVCIIIVISTYIKYFPGPISFDNQKWGTFGDFIGGTLNPILSFLSFIALLITIILQSKELSLSTKELTNSATALKEQNESIKIQIFENTFFQMIGLHNDIVNSIDITIQNQTHTIVQGRDCFKYLYKNKFVPLYNNEKTLAPESQESEIISSSYSIFINNNQSEVGHYFRTLLNTISVVDEAEIVNKEKFINIVKAQMSSYEIILLFYNCLYPYGLTQYKPIVEKYSLLENINSSLLISKDHFQLFSLNAYGNTNL